MTHSSTPSRARPTSFVLLAVASLAGVALAACGGSDDSSSGDQAAAFASAAVCNGEPNADAPDEGGTPTGYVYVDSGNGWRSTWGSAFGDRHAIVGDDASLILCAKVTSSNEAERCEFESDGESFTLVMMEASYDLELRRQETANVIGIDSADVAAEDCPMSTSWTSGESERQSFPEPTEQIDGLAGVFMS